MKEFTLSVSSLKDYPPNDRTDILWRITHICDSKFVGYTYAWDICARCERKLPRIMVKKRDFLNNFREKIG